MQLFSCVMHVQKLCLAPRWMDMFGLADRSCVIQARACADRADAANAALKHAQDIYQQAQAAREAEVKAAETMANEARNAETNFRQALSIEERAVAERTGVENNLQHTDTNFHQHVGTGYSHAHAGPAPAAYRYGY